MYIPTLVWGRTLKAAFSSLFLCHTVKKKKKKKRERKKQLFQAWWYTLHPTLERLRQEDLEFQANLDPDSKT